MNHFAKKFAAIAVAVAALVVPFRPAAGWDEVCVKLPLWKTGFAAHFHVIHGFDAEPPGLPGAVWDVYDDGEYQSGGHVIPSIAENLINRRDLLNNSKTAPAQVQSGTIRANQTKCVSIRSFYEGERFFVLVNVHGRAGKKYVYCELHRSARDPWYQQTSRPYSKMVYHAWGVVGNPKCEYAEEQR